jgi:hypothetical protein
MPALAHQFARLVGSFHGTFSAARKTRVFRSLLVRLKFPDTISIAGARLARLIRDPSRLVNATRRLLAATGGDFGPIAAFAGGRPQISDSDALSGCGGKRGENTYLTPGFDAGCTCVAS